jgi:succinoglycan biosynthesis transport protein ExoP
MMESHEFDRSEAGFGWIINHLPTIVWQRRYYVFALFMACVIGTTVTAFALPTLYRSSATLLIESQDLPNDVAEAPELGSIEQRIAKIRERVLSRGDLIALIEQYDLYSAERRAQPLSKIIDNVRKSTNVGALQGDIGAPSTSGASNVIALKMTFDYPDPVKAQDVLQSFVSSFLKMDSEGIEDQASITVRFLQDQAQKLRTQIQDLEGQITALKSRNGAALVSGGIPSMLDTGAYSAKIIEIENQNRQLLLESRKPAARDQQIAAAEAALAAARAIYADSHPDVVAARERLKAIRQALPANSDNGATGATQEQIRANNEAIASLSAQRSAALAGANANLAQQSRAPAILEQASQLEDRANALREQYKDVSTNLLKAQNNARMAGEQRGERLSLVEPANLPDHPNWPNRGLLIAAGAAAGAVLGLLTALIIEMMKRPLRSPVQIEALGVPVIGIVPIFDRARKRRWWQRFGRREAELAQPDHI